MRVLTREALTAALAARQLPLQRQRLSPAEAIRRLTPLQGQHPPSPHIALAARLEGFTQADLEAALDARHVVKATIMRMTLHVASGDDFPAYAQLARHHRMRAFRARYPELDEERVELLDLPDRPLPPASTPIPPRFLGHWDQPLLAYADRDRILPPAIQALKLTLTGDSTVTVDGRVAASWTMDGPKLVVTPHTDFDHDAVREEALRTARFCAPEHARHEVAFST